MSAASATRPDANEYAPYYEKYVSLISESDIISVLESQLEETLSLIGGLSEEQAQHRYAPDKWSIKQVIGHIIDGERIFAYRALRFSRDDKQKLPGFDQDTFMRYADFDARSMADLAQEFEHARRANILMFRSFNEETWRRRGTASEAEVSVRGLAYIIAGHERHHVGILKSRYL